MATQYTTLLKLALPTQGELSGAWGDVVNNNITSMIEEAVAGLKTIDTWSSNSATLSTANGLTAESRAAMLNLTDSTTDLSGAATLVCPTLSKVYIVKNSTGQTVTIKTASGNGIAISNGNTSIVFCDGTNVVEAVTGITGNLDIGGNLTVGGNATVTGTTTFNGGTLTLGDSAADNVVFGADVNSSIIPNTDDTFDLGSAGQEWRNLYLDGTANIDALVADEATIDSININGKVITMTGDTSDTAIFTAGSDGTLTIATTDAAGAAANITITADGTAELAGTTVTLNSGGGITLDADGGTITFADAGSSLGTITSNGFTGNVVGNVTGNVSGTAATVTGAAQSNITSVGTLTALTIDDVGVDGKVITLTGSVGDTATITASADGALDITTTDAAGAAGNIQITADGTAELAGTTVTLDSSGGITLDADGGTITFADAGISLGTVTSGGFTGNVVGNVTGNVSGTAGSATGNAATATALATARTIGGTSFDGTANIAVGLATAATTVTVSDNESTNENNVILFGAGAAGSGNIGVEADGNMTYNPSTGKITATGFVGALTGDVTGNLTGTVATATQNSITTATGLTSTGALNAGSITSGFGAIDNGASAITTTGAVGTGALTAGGNIIIPNGGNIGSVGDTDAISIASDGVVTFSQTPVGTGGGFPSGTSMLFQQTSAPTGWTKQTTHNDKALRIITGTVGTGGSVAFSTALGAGATVAGGSVSGNPTSNLAVGAGDLAVSVSGNISNTTLSINQIPSHSHSSGGNAGFSAASAGNEASLKYFAAGNTGAAGGGGAHNHGHNISGSMSGSPSISGNVTAGNLAVGASTAAINVSYVDFIIANKD